MNWTETFFEKHYLDIHLPILTDEINNHDVEFIEKAIELKQDDCVLDLPCGYGRHSNLLAKKGYMLTGIDFKENFIEIAREESKNLGTDKNTEFLVKDMREINFENKFDAVINFFTSFGYFDDYDNYLVLEKIAKSLKKGGRFLLDVLNRDFIINDIRKNPQVWLLYPNNHVFMAMNKFDIITGRWTSDQIVVMKGKSIKQVQNVRLYTYTELNFLFNLVGLRIIKSFGDSEGSEYSVKTRSMIIVAEKY